ncbi:hypothetical protein KY289_035796 [Solanum tuberosum]|nr:hypothetical protein KY289_035796 [Solanum tuberosum]
MNQGRLGELRLGDRGNNDDNNQDNVNNPENVNNQKNLNNQGVPPVVSARPVRDVAIPLTANVASSIRKPPLGEITDTYIQTGISSNYVKLKLFPYLLLGAAKHWLDTEPPNSITTWDYLARKFLSRLFPSKKTARLRSEILCFRQNQGEDMNQAWARFKQMLNVRLHHMQINEVLAHTFFEGLDYNACVLLNSAAGGHALANVKSCSTYSIDSLKETQDMRGICLELQPKRQRES